MVYKTDHKCGLISTGQSDNLEYGFWRLQIGGNTIHLLGIYHPPPSDKICSNYTKFMEEFMTLIGNLRSDYKNILIAGDFNIHINDGNDIEAGQFIDKLEALGLKQYVNFPTHKSGNTLDLIINDELSRMKPIYIRPGQFLSDHSTISVLFNIKKDALRIKNITYRKIKDADPEKLINDMNLEQINGDTLDELLTSYHENVLTALNFNAQLKTAKITIKDVKPWYNSVLRDQLKMIRSRERCWRKYREDHQRKAYQHERLIYSKLLYK